jgi:hypothetical protein
MNTTYTIKKVIVEADSGDDLLALRKIPKSDRTYIHNFQWIINNPDKYAFIPAVKAALEDRQKQLDFLGEV